MRTWAVVLALFAAPAFAQLRADTNEWSLGLFVVGTKHYAFDGGATARTWPTASCR